MAPAGWADSITDNISLGTTQVGMLTLTQGGTGGCSADATSVCVSITMSGSNTVRLGGPVIGFSGNINEGGTSMITGASTGSLLAGACGGIGSNSIFTCFDATGSATVSSLTFVLTNAEISTGITVGNIHVASDLCSNSPTCFATTTPTTNVVPEPSTLGLIGTGLFALGSFARRRLLPQQS
jgi:PEP-CTERM motif